MRKICQSAVLHLLCFSGRWFGFERVDRWRRSNKKQCNGRQHTSWLARRHQRGAAGQCVALATLMCAQMGYRRERRSERSSKLTAINDAIHVASSDAKPSGLQVRGLLATAGEMLRRVKPGQDITPSSTRTKGKVATKNHFSTIGFNAQADDAAGDDDLGRVDVQPVEPVHNADKLVFNVPMPSRGWWKSAPAFLKALQPNKFKKRTKLTPWRRRWPMQSCPPRILFASVPLPWCLCLARSAYRARSVQGCR